MRKINVDTLNYNIKVVFGKYKELYKAKLTKKAWGNVFYIRLHYNIFSMKSIWKIPNIKSTSKIKSMRNV